MEFVVFIVLMGVVVCFILSKSHGNPFSLYKNAPNDFQIPPAGTHKKCPKCGGNVSDFKSWCSGKNCISSVLDFWTIYPEHMDVHCFKCSYKWVEAAKNE